MIIKSEKGVIIIKTKQGIEIKLHGDDEHITIDNKKDCFVIASFDNNLHCDGPFNIAQSY